MALSLGRLKDENQLLREENHELLGENDELHRKLHPFRPLLLLEAIPTTEQSVRCCIVTEAFGGSTQAMVTGRGGAPPCSPRCRIAASARKVQVLVKPSSPRVTAADAPGVTGWLPGRLCTSPRAEPPASWESG
eukprot:Hpha_TRINITY_DN16600_c0_g5::TRINITY_DN16600_c0_g5_i2::g.180935::m.180935